MVSRRAFIARSITLAGAATVVDLEASFAAQGSRKALSGQSDLQVAEAAPSTGADSADLPAVLTRSIMDFGARFDSATDDTDAWRNAANWIAETAADRLYPVLMLPPGGTVVSGEIDFSAVKAGFQIHGSGTHNTLILPTKMGRGKKLFNLSCGSKYARIKYIDLVGFQILGNDDIEDPIGVYAPWVSTVQWDLKFVGLNNLNVRIEEIDNSDLSLVIAGAGHQALTRRFDRPVYAETDGTSLNALDDAGNALRGAFTNMEGTAVWVTDGDNSDAARGTWAKRFIVDVDSSGSRCTVDVPYGRKIVFKDEKKISFGPLLGSIDKGGTVLRASHAVLEKADVGREIAIEGAGSRSGVHVCTIRSVDGKNIGIAPAAESAISAKQVWTAPAVLIMHNAANFKRGDQTNDVRFPVYRNESYDGPGIIVGRATGVRVLDGKIHGRHETQDNFAASLAQEVLSNVSSYTSSIIREKGYTGGHPDFERNDANVLVTGGVVSAAFYGEYAPMPDNQPLYELSARNRRSSIIWSPARIMRSRRYPYGRTSDNLGGECVRGMFGCNSARFSEEVCGTPQIVSQAFGIDQQILIPKGQSRFYKPVARGGFLAIFAANEGSAFQYCWLGPVMLGGNGKPGIVGQPIFQSQDQRLDVGRFGKLDRSAVGERHGAAGKLSVRLTPDGWIALINRTPRAITLNLSFGAGGA
ncbi:hypothetical protein [Jiella mangrovi]|uniref:Uncharacterized protein n=1 Tax=Jiella mangrovi TaxID=2821407 RepID=A0ABS4BH03_9HYPH|nr:hypothetical protein [Jiella mangrovi]MBP0616038.1 hypothetical protein [Jiella mangrovi]